MNGVLRPGERGAARSRTVVLVVGANEGDESPGGGSKARNGSARVELLLEGGLEGGLEAAVLIES